MPSARILLLHGIVLSAGGIPLLYLGDEVGTLNDFAYLNDPGKAGDSRWVHRPPRHAERYAQRHDPATDAGRVLCRPAPADRAAQRDAEPSPAGA